MSATKGVTSRAAGSSFNIAVDVGRSSVKIAAEGEVLSFPFLVATKTAAVADYYVGSSEIKKMAKVNGELLLFGEDASLLGDSVVQHTEGDTFRDISVKTTVFAIAYTLFELDLEASDINLAINLTFDNHYQKEEYAKALKAEHTVHFVKEDETFKFRINSVYVLYQGFSGLISVAMDENFKISKDFLTTEGVVIDVGRQTVDFLYVDKFVVKQGTSKDFGTFKIYEKVVDLLKRKHNVIKEPYEIEEHLTANKAITTMKGDKVQLAPFVKEAVQFYFNDVILQFEAFLSKKTPEYVLLLGGGAVVYGPYFREKYKLVEIPEDPQFVNCRGMLRFLNGALKKR